MLFFFTISFKLQAILHVIEKETTVRQIRRSDKNWNSL